MRSMFQNIKRLAINRAWAGHMEHKVEDRVTKSLFLAHFPNLTTLVLVVNPRDVHRLYIHNQTDITDREFVEGAFEVYLQDVEEWGRSVRAGNRYFFFYYDVNENRMKGIWEDAEGSVKLLKTDAGGELNVELKVLRHTHPRIWNSRIRLERRVIVLNEDE